MGRWCGHIVYSAPLSQVLSTLTLTHTAVCLSVAEGVAPTLSVIIGAGWRFFLSAERNKTFMKKYYGSPKIHTC